METENSQVLNAIEQSRKKIQLFELSNGYEYTSTDDQNKIQWLTNAHMDPLLSDLKNPQYVWEARDGELFHLSHTEQTDLLEIKPTIGQSVYVKIQIVPASVAKPKYQLISVIEQREVLSLL